MICNSHLALTSASPERGNLSYLTCRTRFETFAQSQGCAGTSERGATALCMHPHIFPVVRVCISRYSWNHDEFRSSVGAAMLCQGQHYKHEGLILDMLRSYSMLDNVSNYDFNRWPGKLD
jgi:hypothetical protein